VSQGTVRKAIEALASDNLVVRRQGKGTFVTTHTEEKTSTFRFLRIRRNDGHDEYPASRLLDVRRSKASADIARLLELKAGDAGTAAILKVSVGQPLLAVERVTYTYGDRPVEWRRGLCTTRRHYYSNELG